MVGALGAWALCTGDLKMMPLTIQANAAVTTPTKISLIKLLLTFFMLVHRLRAQIKATGRLIIGSRLQIEGHRAGTAGQLNFGYVEGSSRTL